MPRRQEIKELDEHRLYRLLRQIIRNQETQMADTSALTTAVTKLSSDVDALIVAGSSSAADQAAIDTATAAVTAVDDKVVAALPKP
jgi:molybdopterin biosynthesis enzyme